MRDYLARPRSNLSLRPEDFEMEYEVLEHC